MSLLLFLVLACGRTPAPTEAEPAPTGAEREDGPGVIGMRPMDPGDRGRNAVDCKYEPYDAPCTLRDVRVVKANAERVTMEGRYAVEGQEELVNWRMIVPVDREEDLRAHFLNHRETTCSGWRPTGGEDCRESSRWRVKLPFLPDPPPAP